MFSHLYIFYVHSETVHHQCTGGVLIQLTHCFVLWTTQNCSYIFLCVFNFWKLSKDTCPSRRQIYRAAFDIISGKGGMILTFVKQLRYLFLKVLIDEAFDAVFLFVSLDGFLK